MIKNINIYLSALSLRTGHARMNVGNFYRVIIVAFLLVSLFNSSMNNHSLSNSLIESHDINRSKLTYTYTPHIPITITSNDDFISQGWPGNGTEGNPYLIEGLSVIDTSTCISISDTNVYFEITNCLISSPTQSNNNGINFENVTNGAIIDCILENHANGVYLSLSSYCIINKSIAFNNEHSGLELLSSDFCTILNNTAFDNLCGFWLESSSTCTLNYNIAVDNEYGFILYLSSSILENNFANRNMNGFHIYESSFCDLINCTASYNFQSGIFLYNSSFCMMMKNTIQYNYRYGFFLSNTTSCTLVNNTLRDDGIFLFGPSVSYWLHTMLDNSINGFPVGYFKSTSGLSINGSQYGQVLLANCSNTFVKNGIFANVALGVQIGFCFNCTLDNITTIDTSMYGFKIIYSSNCTLINNSAINSRYGFYIESSPYSNLSLNIALNNNGYGYYIADSNSCALTNNTSAGNMMEGFKLIVTSYSVLINNSAYDNDYYGFFIDSSVFCTLTYNFAISNNIGGFYFFNTSHITIIGNNATGNDSRGFLLALSSSCILHNNTASSNNFGIYLDSFSTGNLLFFNYIFSNRESNGYDDGELNSWDNGLNGNYWDDYDGSGVYNISGTAGSVDNHPYQFEESSSSDNNTTATTTPITTTTTSGSTTSTTNQSNLLIQLLVNGIAVGSLTVILSVLILTIRARRLNKTSAS
ncbi:hypothetical protein EU527_12500 [Candidatus Thorarchaeota archaeon]|nr:MAG: hypothetical protein EU527_12500 [Candidatus Thorarchaeota archaeon]